MVKCADCGFLGVRLIKTRQIVDAEEYLRNEGQMPDKVNNEPIYAPWPICFVRKINIHREVKESGVAGPQGLAAVFQKDRKCDDGFTKWFQGFTPKEHQEMINNRWDKVLQLLNLIVVATVPIISVVLSVWLSKAAVTNQAPAPAVSPPAAQSFLPQQIEPPHQPQTVQPPAIGKAAPQQLPANP